jgi:hypothetical protein
MIMIAGGLAVLLQVEPLCCLPVYPDGFPCDVFVEISKPSVAELGNSTDTTSFVTI